MEDAGVFQDPGHNEKLEIANEYRSLEASKNLSPKFQTGCPADVHVFRGPTTLPVPWIPDLRGGITGSTCGEDLKSIL